MTLTLCADVAAADWIVHSTLPWQRLVCFGPAGFDAYARLRLLPDPVRPDQSENDAAAEDWRADQLPRLFERLAAHTTTPDDCYFCVWEGFGPAERGPTRPALAPISDAWPPALPRPEVRVPHRAYWLFRGPLADVGRWDTAEGWPRQHRLDVPEPAFVWPADRAWCVARDVDPHWAGIGAGRRAIDRLVADPLLDVVPADPATTQPWYR